MEQTIIRLAIGLVLLVAVNVVLGSLNALFDGTFDRIKCRNGVIKGIIIAACFVAFYVAGRLNPDIVAIDIDGETVNVATAANLAMVTAYVLYAKDVFSKLSKLVLSKTSGTPEQTGGTTPPALEEPADAAEATAAEAKSGTGSDSGKVELQALLPEGERKKLDAAFEESAKELLAAGVEVGWSKEVKTGFKVGAKEGGYYISFADADIEALLAEYLRDKVFQLLFKA